MIELKHAIYMPCIIAHNKKFQLFDDDNIEIFSVLESKVNYVSIYF